MVFSADILNQHRLYTVKINAKINLSLSVGRPKDGYHELSSLALPISVRDRITLIPSERTFAAVTTKYDCFGEELPTLSPENNSAVRALESYNDFFGTAHSFEIEIAKRIPVGGGLGGSSADAAGVIRLLCEIDGRPKKDALLVAESVGKDVPFMLFGENAVMSGTGGNLEFLPPLGADITLICAESSNSTAEVFAEFDKSPSEFRPQAAKSLFDGLFGLVSSFKAGETSYPFYVGAMKRLDFSNDLLAPARRLNPRMGEIIDLLTSDGLSAFMTGSGSALFVPWKVDTKYLADRFGLKSLIVTTK